jgi:hypothetical protein
MALDPVLITSDIASRTAMVAYKQKVTGATPAGDRKTRPLMRFAESIAKETAVSGEDGAKFGHISFSPGLGVSWIKDEDVIRDPQQINHLIQWETSYAHCVLPIKLIHDEWLRKGYRIKPHTDGMPVRISDAQYSKLQEDLWEHALEAATDDHDRILDLALHRQGATSKELGGLNLHMPILPTGYWCGHLRQNQPLVRHIVARATTGPGGTLRKVLRRVFRQLNDLKASCKLPAGEFFLMAGSDFLDAYIDDCEAAGVQYQADIAGVKKIDGVILDDAIRIGRNLCHHNPTFATLDGVAQSEIGTAISTATVTFSGGGATRQATGLVYVNAAGQVSGIVITDPGAGYTSAPTLTLGSVGSGAGATFQAMVYSTNTGTGLVQVDSEDNRLGRLASVTINAGGANYPIGDQPAFS